jgi:hypothetical protein
VVPSFEVDGLTPESIELFPRDKEALIERMRANSARQVRIRYLVVCVCVHVMRVCACDACVCM